MFSSNIYKTFFNFRLHARRCRPRHGQDVRQRLLPNHNFTVRGPQPVLQEHVQAEAAAFEMAGGCRQLDQQQQRHVLQLALICRQHGPPAQEEDLHRDHSTCSTWKGLWTKPQAHLWRNRLCGRLTQHGERGGQGLVLQQVRTALLPVHKVSRLVRWRRPQSVILK